MKKILFLSLLVGLFYACKKDKIGTKPILSFKGYSADSITPFTQDFIVSVNVEDGDGDIEDTVGIAVLKNSEVAQHKDTFWTQLKMPSIGQNRGNKVKAEVILPLTSETYGFNYQHAAGDSAWFLVFIRDNAGNISDTIATPKFPFDRN